MNTNDGQEVGKVTKQWSGIAREAFTDADNFGINFPMDLDVRIKVVLLASVFLIVSFNQMYFDKKNLELKEMIYIHVYINFDPKNNFLRVFRANKISHQGLVDHEISMFCRMFLYGLRIYGQNDRFSEIFAHF